MKKKNERRGPIRFSAAKFKRLPMAEKLAYLRTALNAVGRGLLVQERRSGPSRTAPRAATSRNNRSLSFRQAVAADWPVVPMLSKADFDRLTIEHKLAYLSRTIRQLKEVQQKVGARRNEPLRQAAHGAAANPVKLRG